MSICLNTILAWTYGQTDRIGKTISHCASIGMLTHDKNWPPFCKKYKQEYNVPVIFYL